MATIYAPDLVNKWYSVIKPTSVYKYAPQTESDQKNNSVGTLSPGTNVLVYSYSYLSGGKVGLMYYNSNKEVRWIIFNDNGSANMNKLFEQGVRTTDEKKIDDQKAKNDEKTWYEKAIKALIPVVLVGGLMYGISQVGKSYVEKKL